MHSNIQSKEERSAGHLIQLREAIPPSLYRLYLDVCENEEGTVRTSEKQKRCWNGESVIGECLARAIRTTMEGRTVDLQSFYRSVCYNV